MRIRNLAFGALLLALATSCSSTKRSPLTYFMDAQSDAVLVSNETYSYPKIEPGDELFITVTSDIPSQSQNYNLPLSNPAKVANGFITTTPQQQTYVVDPQGNIKFPVLGEVHVEGLTISQLTQELTKRIAVDVTNPDVYVRLVNFKVNVGGEVKVPGPQKVTTERYTVLDAISAAGDLTDYGERDNVLLVRQENGKTITKRLDLNSTELLTQPEFYLKQNDFIYVEPNKIKVDNSKYNTNNAFKVSVVSTIVSAVSVVASLVIALCVN